MKSAIRKSGVLVQVAILAAAMVGMTVADEPAKDTLQESWNDYPAKWIENSKQIPLVDPAHAGGVGATTDTLLTTDPAQVAPEETYPDKGYHRTHPWPRPPIRPPIQQQQSDSGGSSYWGGGKTGGGFNWGGGKSGGGYDWGKTRPPLSQQNSIPSGGFDRDQLLEQISELQRQNAMLKDLLQRLAEQQATGQRIIQ